MRVISGKAKGCKLNTIKGNDIRPTTDRTKESIFSIITGYIYDSTVLDLFSGTGGLGIEALSRGASRCVFVDNNRYSLKITKKNLKKTKLTEFGEIIYDNAISFIEKNDDKFDIIFLDPPYNKKILQKALSYIGRNDIIKDKGVIVCESSTDDILKDSYGDLYKRKDYLYGNTKITIYLCKKDIV